MHIKCINLRQQLGIFPVRGLFSWGLTGAPQTKSNRYTSFSLIDSNQVFWGNKTHECLKCVPKPHLLIYN